MLYTDNSVKLRFHHITTKHTKNRTKQKQAEIAPVDVKVQKSRLGFNTAGPPKQEATFIFALLHL